MKNQTNKNQEGFTIIETLITVFVFSILVVAVNDMFVQILNNQRWAFAAQKVQENGSYVMELMAREIRVSAIQNQDSPDCSSTSLSIYHPVNGNITYSLNSNVLGRTVNGVASQLSTSDIEFTRLNFCVIGSTPGDGLQPRVVIIASIKNKGSNINVSVDLQTMVTSRDLSDEL